VELALAACAQVVSATSEVLPECAAANVLSHDPHELWLSAAGLPQALTLLLDEGAVEAPIVQVGIHCWHLYQTNPRVISVSSSRDGVRFEPRGSLECAITDEPQLFELESPIPTDEPYIRIEVHATHGGDRTYLNRLLIRTAGKGASRPPSEAAMSPSRARAGRSRTPSRLSGSPMLALSVPMSPWRRSSPGGRGGGHAEAGRHSLGGAASDAFPVGRVSGAAAPAWDEAPALEALVDAADADFEANASRALAAMRARRAQLVALRAHITDALLASADKATQERLRTLAARCGRADERAAEAERALEGTLGEGGRGTPSRPSTGLAERASPGVDGGSAPTNPVGGDQAAAAVSDSHAERADEVRRLLRALEVKLERRAVVRAELLHAARVRTRARI
jgi:hypothetical protein